MDLTSDEKKDIVEALGARRVFAERYAADLRERGDLPAAKDIEAYARRLAKLLDRFKTP